MDLWWWAASWTSRLSDGDKSGGGDEQIIESSFASVAGRRRRAKGGAPQTRPRLMGLETTSRPQKKICSSLTARRQRYCSHGQLESCARKHSRLIFYPPLSSSSRIYFFTHPTRLANIPVVSKILKAHLHDSDFSPQLPSLSLCVSPSLFLFSMSMLPS